MFIVDRGRVKTLGNIGGPAQLWGIPFFIGHYPPTLPRNQLETRGDHLQHFLTFWIDTSGYIQKLAEIY